MAKTWFLLGDEHVVQFLLVNSNNSILLPVYVKSGLFKNFVEPLNKNGTGFYFFSYEKFTCVRETKIIEGIFVGPKLRSLIGSRKFEDLLNKVEESS